MCVQAPGQDDAEAGQDRHADPATAIVDVGSDHQLTFSRVPSARLKASCSAPTHANLMSPRRPFARCANLAPTAVQSSALTMAATLYGVPTPSGPSRLSVRQHQKPRATASSHCRPWTPCTFRLRCVCACVCVCAAQVHSGVDESDAGVELAAAVPASLARMRPPRTTLSLRLVPTRQPPLPLGGIAAPMSVATPGGADETLAVSWWLYVSPADHIRSKPRTSLSPRPAPAVSAVGPSCPGRRRQLVADVCARMRGQAVGRHAQLRAQDDHRLSTSSSGSLAQRAHRRLRSSASAGSSSGQALHAVDDDIVTTLLASLETATPARRAPAAEHDGHHVAHVNRREGKMVPGEAVRPASRGRQGSVDAVTARPLACSHAGVGPAIVASWRESLGAVRGQERDIIKWACRFVSCHFWCRSAIRPQHPRRARCEESVISFMLTTHCASATVVPRPDERRARVRCPRACSGRGSINRAVTSSSSAPRRRSRQCSPTRQARLQGSSPAWCQRWTPAHTRRC
jgi:hypothetical protein